LNVFVLVDIKTVAGPMSHFYIFPDLGVTLLIKSSGTRGDIWQSHGKTVPLPSLDKVQDGWT
jgi:hypothetical protein